MASKAHSKPIRVYLICRRNQSHSVSPVSDRTLSVCHHADNWNPMGWDRAAEELTWERVCRIWEYQNSNPMHMSSFYLFIPTIELYFIQLLGLDGSLVFLEHVFWVVSLNTLFVLVFGKSRESRWLQRPLRFVNPSDICSLRQHFVRITLASGPSMAWGWRRRRGRPSLRVCSRLWSAMSYWPSVSYFSSPHSPSHAFRSKSLPSVILQLKAILFPALTQDTPCNYRGRVFVGMSYIVVKVTILIVAEIGLFPLVCGWWLDICSLVSEIPSE